MGMGEWDVIEEAKSPSIHGFKCHEPMAPSAPYGKNSMTPITINKDGVL